MARTITRKGPAADRRAARSVGETSPAASVLCFANRTADGIVDVNSEIDTSPTACCARRTDSDPVTGATPRRASRFANSARPRDNRPDTVPTGQPNRTAASP